MQVDSYFFFKCVVPENIHTSPMEGYWKFQGGGGGGLELRLINQKIDELQYILVYLNAICTFSGHF